MKRLITVLSLVALCGLAFAPDVFAQRRLPSQSELEKRKQKKLRSTFLKQARWVKDFDKAKKESRRSGKLILAYFTRSYAP